MTNEEINRIACELHEQALERYLAKLTTRRDSDKFPGPTRELDETHSPDEVRNG